MQNAGDSVLRDTSISLRELIRQRIYLEAPGDIDVELASPADEDLQSGVASRPLVIVFLYDIRQNHFFRNSPPEVSRQDGSFVSRPAPAVVDAVYMILACARKQETELVLTTRLKRLFHDVRVLPGGALKGNLAESGNSHIEIEPNDLSLEELHRVWSGFPGVPYRLALFYTLTPVRIPSDVREPIVPVKDVALRIEHVTDTGDSNAGSRGVPSAS